MNRSQGVTIMGTKIRSRFEMIKVLLGAIAIIYLCDLIFINISNTYLFGWFSGISAFHFIGVYRRFIASKKDKN